MFNKSKSFRLKNFVAVTKHFLMFFSVLLDLIFITFPQELNRLLKIWTPSITFVALAVSIYAVNSAYKTYITEEAQKLADIEEAFIAESCLNLKVANDFRTGKTGEQYVFNSNYQTSFLRNNWADVFKILRNHGYQESLIYNAVVMMENQNKMLSNQNSMPSDDLAKTARDLISTYEQIGILVTNDGCFQK